MNHNQNFVDLIQEAAALVGMPQEEVFRAAAHYAALPYENESPVLALLHWRLKRIEQALKLA